MIIGIDASRANKRRKTGTEWYSFFLIEEFKKISSGHTFRLYTNTPLEKPLSDLPSNFQEARLVWPPRRLWTQIRLSFELLLNRPDILFVPAHVAPLIASCKTVVTVHDVGFKKMPHLYSRIERWYHKLTLDAAMRFANTIICPSHFTRNELLDYYPDSGNKIVVVHHGAAKPLSEIRIGDKDHRDPFFLYIGRLEEKKNILGILNAFKKIVDADKTIKLVLVGSPGYGYGKILSYIEKSDLTDNVLLRGYVSEQEKQELYKRACAFVFPSLYEGFGMPVLEAQSYGCPVITSKGIATEEVAGDSALLIAPKDISAMTEAMISLTKDQELRKRLIDLGLKNVQHFTWKKAADETLQALVRHQ